MSHAVAALELPLALPSQSASTSTARPVGDYPCRGLSVSRIGALAAFALGMILLNKLGTTGNAVFFVIVAAMMLSRPLPAVIAMNLGLLGLMVNFAFVPKTTIWTFSRFANLFVFAGRFTLGGGNARWARSPPYAWVTAFCVVAAICSIANGYYVQISLLKLISFWLAITGIFAAIHTIRRLRIDTTEWFVAQSVAVCGLSALALVMGVGANFKEFALERGFYNLAFYHSQTMGPGAGFLITYCACVYLFSGHRNRWICLPIIGSLAYFLSLTGSRTGLLTVTAGLLTALAAAFIWKKSSWRRPRLNVSQSTIVMAGLLAAAAFGGLDIATNGRLTKRFAAFVTKKTGEVESVSIEDAISSRQGIAEASWNTFLRKPITGIGFQVALNDYFVAHATLFSAPIEKGFLPTAILEEVGIVGTSVFVGFLAAMFRQLRRERNIPGLAMFVAHLASNLGEASYFAVAGQGGYAWMMLMAAIVLGDRCTVPAWFHAPWHHRNHE